MDWQNERDMTAEQFLLAIHQLGISQSACGRFLGVSARQVRRMVRGERDVPAAFALLLRAMIAHGEQPVVPAWHRGDS